MPTLSYEELSQAEREELALCGITTAQQLERCSVATLMSDLENLKSFFPDREMVLSEARVRDICIEEVEKSETENELVIVRQERSPSSQFRHKKNLREEILKKREEAEAERHRKAQARHLSPMEKLERMHGLSSHFHAVRCSHPVRAYVGAWATLLLIVPFFALLIIPAMLLTGHIDGGKPLYFGLGFASLVLPWLLVARRAECGVCHIPLFKFGNYPHNKDAHHLPFLGYTFTTALHIIFLFWFRCPACGTPLKIALSGKSRHH